MTNIDSFLVFFFFSFPSTTDNNSIVTSNHAARAMGVQKLQLREHAYKACPKLLIVEGSDLERYRRHGRNVYETLRDTVHRIEHNINNSNTDTNAHNDTNNTNMTSSPAAAKAAAAAVRRGRGMDEMQVDLTSLLVPGRKLQQYDDASPSNVRTTTTTEKPIYIYGDQKETATLVEDQTGATAVVQFEKDPRRSSPPHSIMSNQQEGEEDKTKWQRQQQQRLIRAATILGRRIQQDILNKTGFTTTLGLSSNPLLAKLASDLQKPLSINVLYPWRAPPLIASMPLRKIPDVGHGTLKLLKPALEAFHGERKQQCSSNSNNNTGSFWTCRDMLQLPTSEIKRVLNSDDKCNMLLQRCRGHDSTEIIDDQGNAPKTVSCENSFRRGTVVTSQSVWKELEDLYVRLPRLLKDRREWSQCPAKAYPTTIKLTARVVDKSLMKHKRRPFVTKSKQIPFARGRELLESNDQQHQKEIVKTTIVPLVQSLILDAASDLNVTRLNIAVTNFLDVARVESPANKTLFSQAQQSLAMEHFANQTSQSQITVQSFSGSNKRAHCESRQSNSSLDSAFKKQRTSQHCQRQPITLQTIGNNQVVVPDEIDPEILAELPPEMVNDIIRDYSAVVRSSDEPIQAKPTRIDHYFFARRK